MVCRRGVWKRERPRCTRIVGSGSGWVQVNVVACVVFLFLYQCVIK